MMHRLMLSLPFLHFLGKILSSGIWMITPEIQCTCNDTNCISGEHMIYISSLVYESKVTNQLEFKLQNTTQRTISRGISLVFFPISHTAFDTRVRKVWYYYKICYHGNSSHETYPDTAIKRILHGTHYHHDAKQHMFHKHQIFQTLI